MAPLALEHICEEISNTPNKDGTKGLTKESRAIGVGAASVVAGGSAGVALQVHNQRLIPSWISRKLLVPIAMAAGTGYTMYHVVKNADLSPNATALHWHRMPYRKVSAGATAVVESGLNTANP